MFKYKGHELTAELRNQAHEIFEMARDFGLTHFPIKFVSVSPKELNAIAAYTGFPSRISHWTYGMDFEDIHKRYQYGVSKIYELVINTDPVIAYLLDTNTLVDQKLVMIHVCGHADFFYNNNWFSQTNRQMLDQMANNASRAKRIMDRVGETRVEDFLDVCFSLDNLIDPYKDHIARQYPMPDEDDRLMRQEIPKLKSNASYMDRYINDAEFIAAQKRRIAEEREKNKKFPVQPERDVLGFVLEHAPKLERWQKTLLAMVREESYYFAPQRMTKIMNEGWATYIHSKFMTGHLCTDGDIIDYCRTQSGVISQGQSLNPYRLGLALFKDIEERWNKGQFGLEWERCRDMERLHNWDTGAMKGKEKIFQVRQTHNDLTFIDDFLTPQFAVEQKLFSYKPGQFGYMEINREFNKVKSHLLQMFANGGNPVIQVADGDFANRGELLLEHVYDGQELDKAKGKDTLENLYTLWSRPIHIDTIIQDEDNDNAEKPVRWSFDGSKHTVSTLQG